MKKFKIAIMSIFTLLLGSVLVACGFKDPQISFKENEVYISVGQTIDLSEYLSLAEVSSDDIALKFEDSSLFDIDKPKIKAKKSGQSYVYAVHNNNVYASMNVIVKQSFSTPRNIQISDSGLLTWSKSYAVYSVDSQPTFASLYKISGTYTAHGANDDSAEPFDVVVNTNSYQLSREGIYKISITANAVERVDASEASQQDTFSYGFMKRLVFNDLSWSQNGTFSWTAVENAEYQVLIDGHEFGQKQTENTVDLSTQFGILADGSHRLSIIVSDSLGQKRETTSVEMTVIKLPKPNISYQFSASDGGVLLISFEEDEAKYVLNFNNGSVVKEFENDGENIATTLDDLASGQYVLTAQAFAKEGNYFQSDVYEIANIYKLPAPTLSGREGNEVDGNGFNLTVSGQTLVDTKIQIDREGDVSIFDGIFAEEDSANVLYEIETSGVYTLKAKLIASAEQNQIGENAYYVLNSVYGQEIEVEKLAAVGTVSHEYSNEKSVLTFEKVGNATNYDLLILNGDDFENVDETLFDIDITAEDVKFEFSDKLENLNLPQNGNTYTFKVVARKNDEAHTINSSTEKQIVELGVATANAKENLNKTFTWTSVANASGYRLEIYTVDRQTFEAGQTDIDLSGMTVIEEEVNQNIFTFESEGYYLVKVFALTDDFDGYISATKSLTTFVCVAEKLELDSFDIGYNGEKFYVQIDNSENVSKVAIYLDDVNVVDEGIESGEISTYLLETDFSDTSKTYEVKVVVKAEDRVLYVDSDEVVVNVKKLAVLETSDITVFEQTISTNATFSQVQTSQQIQVSKSAGSRGVLLYQTNNTSNRAGGEDASTATYNYGTATNTEYSFKYFGNRKVGEIFEQTDGYIYLDSEISTYNISRLNTPTELAYLNGNLTMINTNTALTEKYVLTLLCKVSATVVKNVVIEIGQTAKARYQNYEEQLSYQGVLVENDQNVVTFDIDKILQAVSNVSNVEIRQAYSQATEYGFTVYCYAHRAESEELVISSNYATLKIDSALCVLQIEKMAEPEISFNISANNQNITLNWNVISVDASVASQTKYEVYVNGVKYGEDISGTTTASYSLSGTETLDGFDIGRYYTFEVHATNPYYIDSNSSNRIRIYRLNKIESLKLISGGEFDGELEYQVLSAESDFCDYVSVNNVENNTGKIEIAGKTSVELKVVGKKNIESDGLTTTYIDSETTTWNLADLSTLLPAVANQNISLSNEVISWSKTADGQDFDALAYMIVFEDSVGNVALYKTRQNSVSLSESGLDSTLQTLVEGDVDAYVYALLDTYSVVAGGTIYYANQITLENDASVCNYVKYAGVLEIKKLNTPEVTSVAFVSDNVLNNYDLPNIEIEFVGNYDNTADFLVGAETLTGQSYVKNFENRVTLTKADNKFKYVLESSLYKNYFEAGQTIRIVISALSSTDIPSSIGSVEIVCANALEEVLLVENSDLSLSNNIKVDVDEEFINQTAGGFVFKIEYTPNGQEKQTTYVTKSVTSVAESQTFDFTTFFADNLADGGKIKIYAITNSYANDASKVYYLACPSYVASAEYDVLNDVEEGNLAKTSGGFVIDSTLNNTQTTYVVMYHAKAYEVEFVGGQYYFEFDPTWGNGAYSLTIYAKQNGRVISKRNTVNFTLSRIETVGNVSFTRDPSNLADGTITWSSATNAQGYIFRIYEDQTRAVVLYEVETSTNSLHISDVFGDDFYDQVGNIYQDKDVFIGIIAVGQNSVSNNSLEYNFAAKIRGINYDVEENVYVDEYGLVNFTTVVGNKYLYRFVSLSGEAFTDWALIEADKTVFTIDASDLNDGTESRAAGNGFNLEIINVGDLNSAVVVFDSNKVSTKDSSNLYIINGEINSISYGITDGEYIKFVYASQSSDNAFDKIYYGLSEDALLRGEVSEFETTLIDEGSDGKDTYGLKIIDLILDIKEKFELQEGNVKLYFWGHTTSSRGEYINSPASDYTFKHTQTIGFRSIEKYGAPEGGAFNEDYANVFATFNASSALNIDVGVIIRINQNDFYYTELVSIEKLRDQKYYSGDSSTLALNITEIFETNDILASMHGEFKIEFARIKYALLEGKFEISAWTQAQTFTRLEDISRLTLSGGALYWINNDANTQKYYVYLIDKNSYRLDGTLGVDYSIFSTQNLYYIIMDLITEKSELYVAVQAINEDAFVIASTRVFITENDTVRLVKKNKIESELKLENGKFFFDWDAQSEFVNFLQQSDGSINSADSLMKTTFTVPFSFTINDIVTNSIRLRLRFTDVETEKSQSVDVDAREFLLNLFTNYSSFESKLLTLAENAGTRANQESIRSFVDLMKNSNNGVANQNILFDKYFEAVQAGEYRLEYSLVGRNYTISSNWKTFKNTNDDEKIYVSAQPYVSVNIETDQNNSSMNGYRLFIKMSDMYDYDTSEGVYKSSLAEHYVWKVYNNDNDFVFDIQASGSGYAMTLLGGDSTAVTVYRCDIDGTLNENGQYLMFYLNLNGGNSVLGRYGDEITRTNYKFQIYAVGNDYAISSKSEVFNITFLGFDTGLNVANGTFTWTTQMNRNATVIYKKDTSLDETRKVIDGSASSLSFDLADDGDGLYNYIKFITFGEVSGNNIYVDSDVYMIENVYKLAKPQLTNSVGRISINDTKNKQWIDGNEDFNGCYSDTKLYTYRIYNNVSTETSYIEKIDADMAAKNFFYEAGTTGTLTTDADYIYKATEEQANSFYVASIGSTASFKFTQDEDNYNVKMISCLDTSLQETNKNVAITSSYATLNAGMIDKTENVLISNGLLTWTAVTGRGDLGFNANAKAVYKITVKQYNKTETETTTVNTQVGDEFTFFTDETNFDFAVIHESDLDASANYFSATVQACVMSVSTTKPSIVSDDDCEKLIISGKIAYGNLQYSETNQYILLSEGVSVYDIQRTESVDNGTLRVEGGKLVWSYSVDASKVVEGYNILSDYGFSILDSNFSTIQGVLDVSEQTRTNGDKIQFDLNFSVNDGQLEAGANTLSVYAVKLNVEKAIKSYSKSIIVNKMKLVEEADFEINSTSDPTKEIMSFAKYFEQYPTAIIKVSYNDLTFTLNVDNNSITILNTNSASSEETRTLVITDSDNVPLGIYAEDYSIPNCIYSDVNNKIVLQRSSWSNEDQISWNDETDTFSWTYSGQYALQEAVSATEVEQNQGEYREIGNQVTLAIGALYDVVENLSDDTTIIEVDGAYYKISTSYIIGPTYIVTIYYANGETRIYTTKDKFIEPTIIGDVTSIAVKIKLGTTNIQSQELQSDGGFVYDLFESGDGTEVNPYIISSPDHLLNLRHRMAKNESLYTYIQNEIVENTAEIYYFKLKNSIDIFTNLEYAIIGTLFDGVFEGSLDGNGKQIMYRAKNSKALSQSVMIGTDSYDYGVSLFDKIGSKGIVKNLWIDANYTFTGRTSRHTMIAGLALTNNGYIENVSLVQFYSTINGSNTVTLLRLAYSGIVGVNAGSSAIIKNCAMLCDVNISTDDNDQLIRFSGIASVNYATIDGCKCGETEGEPRIYIYGTGGDSEIEIAGIVNTNGQNAIVKNCKKYAEFLVYSTAGRWTVKYGTIYIENNGTLENNEVLYREVVNQHVGPGVILITRIGY